MISNTHMKLYNGSLLYLALALQTANVVYIRLLKAYKPCI